MPLAPDRRRFLPPGWMVSAAIALFAAGLGPGCAMGDDGVNPRGRDGGTPPGADAATEDAGTTPLACDPPCEGADVCRDGVCVPEGVDMDGDGVPAATDCDDDDAAVGTTGERPCSSDCGAGVERCTDGAWADCTAPLTCDCPEGAPPRELDCERCGTQRQLCVEGMWMDDGACSDMGPCTPGEVETGDACGCGTERRTCRTDCTWGAWECAGAGAGECSPGETDMETRACGNCSLGTQSRTRSCDGSTCAFGAWSDWSTCVGGGACAPGETRTGCDTTSSGASTACGVERCQSDCTWGTTCELAPGAACMSGSGTTYQCCTPSGGGTGWQFCDSATCQWFPCASHSC